MKSQKHNEGELKEITLKLEVELIKAWVSYRDNNYCWRQSILHCVFWQNASKPHLRDLHQVSCDD